MKRLALMGVALAALMSPAYATLQISISDGVHTFTCADGQAGCDLGGGANNLLTLNTVVGNFDVFGTLSLSTLGGLNNLSMSSFDIKNTGATTGTVTLLVSDTNFVGPTKRVNESASLTFNNNVGAGPSTLQFFADPLNRQGANPTNTPGFLLNSVTGTAFENPDSFAGTFETGVAFPSIFSMTEAARINLLGGGSITGFDQDMQAASSAVPEPKTWAMLAMGFGLMAMLGLKSRKNRLATFA